MPILIPAKSLTGPQGGATGILAGLLQGLAQGMPIGEQLKNQKRRTDLADQEMQLRRGQIGRQNAREDAAQRAAAILAKFGSMSDEDEPDTMGGGGPAPSTSGASDAEMGGTGPPTQGPPAPAPNGWEGFQPAGMAAAFGAGPPVQGPPAPSPQGGGADQGYTPPPQRDENGRPVSGAGWVFGPNGEAIAQPIPLAITRAGSLPSGSKQGAQPGGQPQGPTAGVQGLHPGTSKRLEWIHGVLSDPEMTKGMSPEDIHGILAAAQRDEHIQAVQTHAQRIGVGIGDNMKPRGEKGENAYTAYDKYGNPDDSSQIAAQHFQEQIQNLDWSDPQHAAAVLDKIEEADLEVRKDASAKRSFAQARQQMDMGFQQDMANAQAQGPDSKANSETTELYNDWHSNNVTDEEMKKKWPLARRGMLHATEDMEKMKARLAQAEFQIKQYEAAIAQNNELKTRNEAVMSGPEGYRYKKSVDEQANMERDAAKPRGSGTSAKPPSANSQMQAIKNADEWLQAQGLEPGTPEYKAAEAELMKRIGMNGAAANEAQGGQKPPAGKDTAQSLWSAFKGGQISKEELKKRAAAAGLSPDEFKALAGAK